MAQIGNLFYIFPTCVKWFTASVMDESEPLGQADEMGKDVFPDHFLCAFHDPKALFLIQCNRRKMQLAEIFFIVFNRRGGLFEPSLFFKAF